MFCELVGRMAGLRSRSPVVCLDAKDGSILGEISSNMFQVEAHSDHAPGL